MSVAVVVPFCALLTTGSCAVALRPPSRADSTLAAFRLDAVLDGHWVYVEQDRPDLALWAGRHVDRLPDVSLRRTRARRQFARDALSALDEITIDALPPESYLTWLALRWDLDMLNRGATFHYTNLAAVAPMQSPLRTALGILGHHPLDNAADVQHYLSLLRGTATLVDSIRAGLDARRRRGVVLSGYLIPRAAGFLRSLIEVSDNGPFTPAARRLTSLDSITRSILVSGVGDVLENQLHPALERLAGHLSGAYAAGAPRLIGLGQYPGGLEHYRWLLRLHSTVDVTPEDAHRIGLEEVTRLQALAGAAQRAAGLPADRDSLRLVLHSPLRIAAGEAELIEHFTRHYQAASALLAGTPDRITALALEVTRQAPRDEPFAPPTLYRPPAVDDARASYELNVSRWARRSMVTIAGQVHRDLMPGRHVLEWAQRSNAAFPAFRRATRYAGMTDGWGVYALALADSLLESAGAEDRFGARLVALADACGLVIDTGINYFGWSRERALEFLREHLPDDDEELEQSFIIPAAEAPGSLTAATLGARELLGLRRWAERELGSRFNLVAFHNELLSIGSLPLPVAGAHLEWWIWQQQRTVPDTTRGTPMR
jgi:uncharacterized protein (DUF885 family)